jgi:hypothetical protein
MAFYNMVIVGGTDAPGSIENKLNHLVNNTYPDMVYSLGDGVNVTNAGHTVSCSGTSFATPEVSGIIDYIWSKYPSLNASQIVSAFQWAVMDVGVNGTLPQDSTGHTNQSLIDAAIENAKYFIPEPTPVPIPGNATNNTEPTTGLLVDLPDELPDATAEENYHLQLSPSGGVPPYTYEMQSEDSGFYYTNIDLSFENGILEGTPPYTSSGTYKLQICINDATRTRLCGNTTLKVLPPPEETWSGTITTSRYECEDIIHGGWSGRLDGSYTFTITVRGNLYYAVLNDTVGETINPYYGLNQSGTWSGTDTVGMACGKSDYKVVGGSVSNVPIMIKAKKGDIWLVTKDYIDGELPDEQQAVLLPGGWMDISGQGGIGGRWDGLTLNATSISDVFISGNVIMNEMDTGTFTMARQ